MYRIQGISVTAFWAAGLILCGCTPAATPLYDITSENIEIIAADQNGVHTIPTTADPYDSIDPTGQTITFWHTYQNSDEDALLLMIDDFNKGNPWSITVKAVNQGGTSSIFNNMLTVIKTSDMPNLVLANQSQAAAYQLNDTLVDLNDLVFSPRWGLSKTEQGNVYPGIFNQDVFPNFRNTRLGFPFDRSLDMLYYNRDWLRELGYNSPPSNPELFKAITCQAAHYPFSKTLSDDHTGYELNINTFRFASWVFAFGGDIFDDEGKQYVYDSQEAIAAGTFIQDLINDGCATLVMKEHGDQEDFSQGKVLFTIDSTASIPFYNKAVDNGSRFNWDISALPQAGINPSSNVYGASLSIPKTNREAQLASWLFIKYTIDPLVQVKWVRSKNTLPVCINTAKILTEDNARDADYQTIISLLPYIKSEPSTPGYDFVSQIVKEAIAAIMAGADVKQTLEELNRDANTSLAEYLAHSGNND